MVSLEKFGRVYVLTLLGDVDEHRFNSESCKAIVEALEVVHNADDAGALVTTNEGKFFSNGLDLAWVKRIQNEEIRPEFTLEEVLAALINLNVPTIAAICGHASAGGYIFALAHDHRCMRSDRGYLYMSELEVKIRPPPTVMAVIRTTLSPQAFKYTMLEAPKTTAEKALEMGIVDSIHENSAKTLEAAMAWATKLCNRGWDRSMYRHMRLDMHPELTDVFSRKPPLRQYPSKL